MKNNAQDMSASEKYAFEFQNTEPKYFTQVANIIDHLTYTKTNPDGTTSVERLSVFAKELYRIIRMIASDDGSCFNTTENLAIKINCSAGSVYNAKNELKMPMHQLDGNPLIFEKKVTSRTFDNGKVKDSRPLCVYTIFDLWKWNNAFMSTLKFQKVKYGQNPVEESELSCEHTDSPYESVPPTDSPHESVSQGTDSPHEANKNPNTKNPLYKKQQQPVSSVCSVSSLNKDSVFSEENKVKAYEWLTKNGCPEGNASAIVNRFCLADLIAASEYSNNQFEKNKAKGKPLGNKWAYFQTVLNKRYWEKK
jgi:hypothetical protein